MKALGTNRVVPVAVEAGAHDIEGGHLGVCDFLAFGIAFGIQFAPNVEAGRRARCRNQADDDREAFQWTASPILADEREEPMLDLVPLARARREVADGDRQARLRRKLLKLPLPQARTGSVAASRIRGDQQRRGTGICAAPHRSPPPPDAFDRKGRRVVIDSDAHPAGIPRQVVHPVRNGLPLLRQDEVVHPHALGLALRTPFSPCVFEVADQFLLLRVHGNNGLGRRLVPPGLPTDVLELRIPVRVATSFLRFLVRLEAVPCLAKERPNGRVADGVSEPLQLARQLSKTLAGPPQRQFGVATSDGLDQGLQVRQQTLVDLLKLLPSCPGLSDSLRIHRRLGGLQLQKATTDRCPGNPRCFRYRSDSPMTQRLRLGRRHQTSAAFVERRHQRPEFVLETGDVHS